MNPMNVFINNIPDVLDFAAGDTPGQLLLLHRQHLDGRGLAGGPLCHLHHHSGLHHCQVGPLLYNRAKC